MTMRFVTFLLVVPVWLFAQAPPDAPTKAERIKQALWNGVTCTCAGNIPRHAGKDFGGDAYFDYRGTLYRFQEVEGRLRFRDAIPTPDHLTPQAQFRNGDVWDREDETKGEGPIRIWSAGHGQLFQVNPARGFSRFTPLFDGRLLLIHSWAPGTDQAWLLEISDGHHDGVTKLEDWPKSIVQKNGQAASFALSSYLNLQVLPVDEFVLLYSQISGRLEVVDASQDKVTALDLPWTAPEGEDLDAHRDEVERSVPKCVQIIPAPGGRAVFVWDEQSRGLDLATWRYYLESGKKRPVPQWKALSLDLSTGESHSINVPDGLELPLWSPDGETLKPLPSTSDGPSLRPAGTTASHQFVPPSPTPTADSTASAR